LWIEKASGNEITDDITTNAKLTTDVHAENSQDASVDEEECPTERSEPIVNRTADEENDPHQVTKGINGNNAYVDLFMSALAINGRINGEERHKWNQDVLQEVHAMLLAGHQGSVSELYVGSSERKEELKEVKNTPIEWPELQKKMA